MKAKLIIGFLFLLIITIQAMEGHYWDQAIGNRAVLLCVVAVGGINDYSATFYNPGALSFLTIKI